MTTIILIIIVCDLKLEDIDRSVFKGISTLSTIDNPCIGRVKQYLVVICFQPCSINIYQTYPFNYFINFLFRRKCFSYIINILITILSNKINLILKCVQHNDIIHLYVYITCLHLCTRVPLY